MMRERLVAMLCAGSVAAALASCGGDAGSNEPTSGDTPLTQGEYQAMLLRICDAANAEIAKAAAEVYVNGSDASDVERFIEDVLTPTLLEEVDRFREIPLSENTQSPDDEQEAEDYYDQIEQSIEELGSKQATAPTANQIAIDFSRPNHAAEQLGVDLCPDFEKE